METSRADYKKLAVRLQVETGIDHPCERVHMWVWVGGCAFNSLLHFALVTLVASYHTRTSLAQEIGNLFARRSAPRRHRADATPGRDEAAALHRPPARDVEALLVRLAID